MKQTTKILLPLGLFMSIVIPITVKTLFTDTDFFEKDENSGIDYLQPYKIRPEAVTNLPQLSVGEDGSVQVTQPASETSTQPSQQSRASERASRERKLTMPQSEHTATIDEAISTVSVSELR